MSTIKEFDKIIEENKIKNITETDSVIRTSELIPSQRPVAKKDVEDYVKKLKQSKECNCRKKEHNKIDKTDKKKPVIKKDINKGKDSLLD